MPGKSKQALPKRLETARQRFERWRRTRKPPSRIPERLWTSAVKLSRQYGVHRTARALRLDYMRLKKRAAQSSMVADRGIAPTFLEVVPTQSGFAECIVEVENASGEKMRIHLNGTAVSALEALTRSFLSPGQ